jgi:Methyltransferase domain
VATGQGGLPVRLTFGVLVKADVFVDTRNKISNGSQSARPQAKNPRALIVDSWLVVAELEGAHRAQCKRRFSRNPVLYGATHPDLAINYLTLSRRFCKAFDVDRRLLQLWKDELVSGLKLPALLASRWTNKKNLPLTSYSGGATLGPSNEILYFAIRASRPILLIETGVAAGFSSSYILAGLEANGGGILHSIDLPTLNPAGRVNADGRKDRSHVDRREETGFVIPDELRKHWQLHVGSSRVLLAPLLEKLDRVDFFWHDSDHSYENMKWEYQTAWPRLNPTGWLASDDIGSNSAFKELEVQVGTPGFHWLGRGAIRRDRI